MARAVEQPTRASTRPDRNLALDLVRVTEAAAMGAGRWIGRGDKIAADQAAVDAMRAMLDTVAMDGVVVIGEGEKDEAPMLYNGEHVGDGTGSRGRRRGRPARRNAPDRARTAERDRGDRSRGARHDVLPGRGRLHGEDRGRARGDRRHRHQRVADGERQRAREGEGVTPREISVVVLERERHNELIAELREAGAKVNLIRDGDVAPAIAAAQGGTGVDMLYGIGGTPEGVISAAALEVRRRRHPGRSCGRATTRSGRSSSTQGLDPERVLTTDDLVAGEDVFVAATGVTTGSLLRGVRYLPNGVITDSISMRSRTGTVRRIEASHHLDQAPGVHRPRVPVTNRRRRETQAA